MAVYTKKSTRAKPVLAVAGVKYRSGRFLRVGRAFFAPGNGDLGRMATANLILITRQPRWSPIAAGGIGVTFLPLECRSGSLRADSYLCATPEARDGLQTKRKTEERERIEKGNCSTCVHPLTVQYMLSPPVRILEILQRVNTGMRMQALLYSSPRADFSSFFVFFATYSLASFIPLQHSTSRLLLSSPSSPFSSTFAALRHFFFFASRLHAKANTTLIYLSVSAGTHVIYCDLIAFNSSGATVNHRASRIARVRHACCRYDVIIRSSASPRWACE